MWSGDVAAARLGLLTTPQTVTIYANQLPAKLVMECRLARDLEGPIEILQSFWDTKVVSSASPPASDPSLAPALLIYTDLLELGSG